MTLSPRSIAAASATLSLATNACAAQADARVTQIVREVKLLPGDAAARAAALNDRVSDGTAVRTGDSSRSELTFADLTITRIGSNSIFSFNKAGRAVQLENGSVLLRVPKKSGGGAIVTSAVTAGITGTTVIMESARAGRSRLLVLEGAARLSLNKHRDQAKNIRVGQVLEVPAGATTLNEPVDLDLTDTIKQHPLLARFPPLPSQDLIVAAAQEQKKREPVYQGQPVAGQPATPGGGGLRFPPGLFPNPTGNPGAGRGPITSGGAVNPTGQRGGDKNPPRRATPAPKKNPNDSTIR